MAIERAISEKQAKPAAATDATLYTVPRGFTATVMTIDVCNQAATMDYFRLWIANAGEADAVDQRKYYDVPVPGNNTFTITRPLFLSGEDLVRIRSTSGNISFQLTGTERQQ